MRYDLDPEGDIVAAVRASQGSIVLVLAPGRTPLSLAQACAAIPPLAAEAAPDRRVNALVLTAAADPVAVDAAIAFLDSAHSTTGQVLTIG